MVTLLQIKPIEKAQRTTSILLLLRHKRKPEALNLCWLYITYIPILCCIQYIYSRSDIFHRCN